MLPNFKGNDAWLGLSANAGGQEVHLVSLYRSKAASPAFGLLSQLSELAAPEAGVSAESFSGLTSLLLLLLEKCQLWVRVSRLSSAGSVPQQSSQLYSPQTLIKCSYRSAEMSGVARPSAPTCCAPQATAEHPAAPKVRPKLILYTFWKGSHFPMSSNRLQTPRFLGGLSRQRVSLA